MISFSWIKTYELSGFSIYRNQTKPSKVYKWVANFKRLTNLITFVFTIVCCFFYCLNHSGFNVLRINYITSISFKIYDIFIVCVCVDFTFSSCCWRYLAINTLKTGFLQALKRKEETESRTSTSTPPDGSVGDRSCASSQGKSNDDIV